ncbi:BrnT family toxin [Phyllobacterium zundukense]|uniref:Toxin n=1 Tax=Phyllobacterium zundukense TaxID=1867719 RepID=A0A2N9VU66_9HYPH|nr:BrnT family toxin [Phyllobacterium zundukense]ATU93021.1 toxin [Phyllobacterium zundukense]PIO43034.1 toxin [Phyllobacterium zundukense]
MLFEYDPAKSASNKIKHGIDFEEAQSLWKDERMLEAPAKLDGEPRFLVIGLLRGKHWSAICVHRSDKVRIISVRRARRQEIEYYENE